MEKDIEITVEETGETWDLMSLIMHLGETRFEGNSFHPDLDELWDLYNRV